ncbi:MAG: ABC transporter substrate-binding protein [Acidimicrobiia bacterium]|nr:ABC transporter substrate-binding protein [Acidimicrobiia bacterium]
MTKKLWLVSALLLTFALFAAACGSSDDSGDSAGSDTTEPTDGSDTTAPTDGTEPADSGSDATVAPDDGSVEPAGDPEPAPGFDGETIKLGYLTDESGPLAILGVPLTTGSQIYWDYVNEELGGVGGRYQVELATGDTKDDPSSAVQEYQRLKDDSVLFAQILSTPPTQAVLEFLKEDNIVGVPGSLAGTWANEAVLMPNGAAYEYEMINIADWFVNDSGLGGVDTVQCVVSVNDLYGEVGLDGLEYAAGELGFELTEKRTMNRNDTDFAATVSALDQAGCEAVYAITVPREQSTMMAEAATQGFDPIWLGALPSYLSLLAGPNFEKFYVALDNPDFNDTSVPGMVDFLERFETYKPDSGAEPNSFFFSGYYQQIAVHALLEKAVELGDLSREGIANAMTQLGEVETDGLTAENYVYGAPEDRIPTSASRIFVYDPDNPPNLLTELALLDSELNDGYELGG